MRQSCRGAVGTQIKDREGPSRSSLHDGVVEGPDPAARQRINGCLFVVMESTIFRQQNRESVERRPGHREDGVSNPPQQHSANNRDRRYVRAASPHQWSMGGLCRH